MPCTLLFLRVQIMNKIKQTLRQRLMRKIELSSLGAKPFSDQAQRLRARAAHIVLLRAVKVVRRPDHFHGLA